MTIPPSKSGRQRPPTAAHRKTQGPVPAQPAAAPPPAAQPVAAPPVRQPGTTAVPRQSAATPGQPQRATGSTPTQQKATGSTPTQRPGPRPPPAKAEPVQGSDRIASAGKTSDRQQRVARSGEQMPIKAGSGPRSPGRQNTSDRQGGGRQGGARAAANGGPRIALKMKFTLVMAGVTTLAMIVLGLAMSQTTQRFLLGQKTQSGIEIGRMACAIGEIVRNRVDQLNKIAEKSGDPTAFANIQQTLQDEIQAILTNVQHWGNETQYTDIEGIRFNCPKIRELSDAGIGSDNGLTIGDRIDGVFIPKLDTTLSTEDLRSRGIQVYRGQKDTGHGLINVLRFKISLPKEFGQVGKDAGSMEDAHVRVDIAMASIDKVSSNLTSTILLAVVVAIGVVVAIALWFSTSITKPLERLLRDMQIVSKGRLDHRTGASSNDEVGLLAVEFNKMTASLEEAQAAVIEQEKAAYELSLAREVQQQLLPAQPPLITGFQCHSFYQGAKAVSGDYFDFIPLADGLWGFIIADVSGKGIPGSMVMAVTRTVVRLVAPRHGTNAAETLKDTNRLIAKQIKRGMFVTSFYAVLDERTGVLTYASAGHNPMVIYRAKTRTHELATTKGIALGFNEGPVFDRTIQVAETTLGKGDTIVLYTDGFPEAMNDNSEEFGEDNFYQLVAANGHLDCPALVEAVVAGVATHRGDAEQSDDLTMLTVRRA